MRGFGGPTAALIAVLLGASGAQAQGLDAARAFTTKLYSAYASGAPDYAGRDAQRVFAAPLLTLIRRDQAAAAGEVGILDGDPICDCQDAGGVSMTHLAVKAAGAGRARAEVTLRFPGEELRALELDLVSVRGKWRVADVHSKDTPSLVRLLENGLDGKSPNAR
jgi:hypothetical protein